MRRRPPLLLVMDLRVVGVVAELARWASGRRRRVRVVGPSMEPTIAADEYVLVDESNAPIVGDVVVAVHPDHAELTVIKRLMSADDDHVVVHGDHPTLGTDSRQWGPLPADAIQGRVTLVLDRPFATLRAPEPRPMGAGDDGGRRRRRLLRALRRGRHRGPTARR